MNIQEINTYTVPIKGDKILVVKRKNGFWEFPGGKIEWGENPREAAIRECKEEVGAEPEEMLFVGTTSAVYEKEGDIKHSIYLIYLVRKLKNKESEKESEIVLSSEHDEYRWLTIDELKFLKLGLNAEPVPELIEDLMQE